MATRRRQDDSDDDPGAPEWMVTFSDCMTLLLTFFVLLISFSSFDDKVFQKMESAFTDGFASVGIRRIKRDEAFRDTPTIIHDRQIEKGSEKPTVKGQYESNPNESLEFMDFQNQKVFLVPSSKVFLGRGTLMSPHGRRMLADVASLLEAVPNRVIISEHPLEGIDESGGIGLRRAWTITQVLAGQHGLNKARLSISAAGTVEENTLSHSGLMATNAKAKRVVEIVILERSIYN